VELEDRVTIATPEGLPLGLQLAGAGSRIIAGSFDLAFQLVTQGNQVQISGTIPATCCDFKIDRPSFLTVPIKNEIPVRLETTWRPM